MKDSLLYILLVALIFFSNPLKSQTDRNQASNIYSDTTLANQYFTKAEKLSKEAHYDSSNFYFKKTSSIYEKAAEQNDEADIWEKYVSCFYNIGRNLRRKGEYDSAMVYLKKAVELGLNKLGEKHPNIALSYNNIGIIYRRTGDYAKALEFYNKALSIRLEIFGEEHPAVASCYNNIGIIFYFIGEYNKALETHYKALSIRLKALNENHLDIAVSYNNLGNTYFETGDYDKALEFHQKALFIKLKVLSENHPDLAISYHNIGAAYSYKGDYDKALQFDNQALLIRLKILGKNHPDVGLSYLNIGTILWKRGDYSKALEFFLKALAIELETFGERHHNVGTIYHNIGNIYIEKKDYDSALEYHNKSLSIMQELLGEKHREVADGYHSLGHIYNEKKDYPKALELLQKALSIRLEALGEIHPDVARSYYSLGQIYNEKRDYEKALEFNNKALLIRLKTLGETHPDVANSYNSIGGIYYRQYDVQKALSFFQKAIISLIPGFLEKDVYRNPPLKSILLATELLTALRSKAEAFEKYYNQHSRDLKDLSASITNYELAAQLIDRIRVSYKTEGSKLMFSEDVHTIYDKAIQTTFLMDEVTGENIYQEKAFNFAEKSKSGILLESISDAQARLFSGIPDSLVERERELNIDLTFYDTQLQTERLKKEDQDSVKIREFENRFFILNREYETLIETLGKDYPRYYDLKYQVQTVTIPEIQEKIDEHTALLEYFVGDSTLNIFAITKSEFKVHNQQINSGFIEMVNGISGAIQTVDKRGYIHNAVKLYDLLIQPVTPTLAGKDHLVIIPHGLLYKIPFDALLSNKPRSENASYSELDYLVKKYAISYHYSTTLYTKSLKEKLQGIPAHHFAGFAPVFAENNLISQLSEAIQDYVSDLFRSYTIEGEKIEPLPATEKEVESISDLFQQESKEVIIFTHQQATEENFKNNIRDYQYVHLATHGFMDPDKPKLSHFAFSQEKSSEDGILFARETYNLDLNADLVVLSACESGVGKLVRGEGMIALSRGFLYSGARNLLVSLWKVKDENTSRLMVNFYQQLFSSRKISGQNGYAAALREAKLTMLKDQRSWAPFFWSGFVLIGQ